MCYNGNSIHKYFDKISCVKKTTSNFEQEHEKEKEKRKKSEED